MKKVFGTMLLIVGLSSLALAGNVIAPEIDGASAISALTLISGAALVIKSRKR